MHGKRVVLTGATSGLGLAVAQQLARAGARVVLCGRSAESTRCAADAVMATAPGAAVETARADMSDLADVEELAARIAASGAVDVLVNNAGAAFASYGETASGFERTVAVNHVAPLLLTALLTPHLTPSALVVAVSSRTVEYVMVDETAPDVQGRALASDYTQLKAYGTSKLLHLLSVRSMARRAAGRFTPVLFDPGGIQTDFARKAGDAQFLAMTEEHWDAMSTAEQAAADLVSVLEAGDLSPGVIYAKQGVLSPPPAAEHAATCDLVYDLTAKYVPPLASV